VSEEASKDTDYQPVWARSQARKAASRREPSFKRLILNLIVVAVIAAVVAFFIAPAVAFFGIRAAAQAGDVQGLSRLIDYDAVRASLRPQVSGRVEPLTPPPSILQDPIGAIRRQFEQAVPQVVPAAPPVDAWLAPGPLIALTSGAGRDALTVAENPAGQTVRTWPRPTYWSVNRARLSVADDANAPTVFTFERRGPFEWKLVHIGLPPEGSVAP
jgi:hypothetical protein